MFTCSFCGSTGDEARAVGIVSPGQISVLYSSFCFAFVVFNGTARYAFHPFQPLPATVLAVSARGTPVPVLLTWVAVVNSELYCI